MQEDIYVLDAGVFIKGYAHLFHDRIAVTTSLVIDEIKSTRARLELEKLRYTSLNVVEPNKERFDEIRKFAKEKGIKLSHADMAVVAVAHDLFMRGKKVIVVSEDYSVQNICSLLGISFMSVEREGISKELTWIRVCPACKRRVKEDEEYCSVCGSKTIYIVEK